MNLNMIMSKKAITNAQIATFFEVTPSTVSRWRNNINQPDNEILPELCDFLNCTLDELLRSENITSRYSCSDPSQATAIFAETVERLLKLCKSIDEPSEITEMVADLIYNGEANYDVTKQFVERLGDAVAKSILFLRQLSPNTPVATEALATIEREVMSRAA